MCVLHNEPQSSNELSLSEIEEQPRRMSNEKKRKSRNEPCRDFNKKTKEERYASSYERFEPLPLHHILLIDWPMRKLSIY